MHRAPRWGRGSVPSNDRAAGRRTGIAVGGRHTLIWGAVITVILLALAILLPFKGNAFPSNLAWLWIPLVAGIIVALLPRRFFLLWFFIALIASAGALSWSAPGRLAPIFLALLAGAEIGSVVAWLRGGRLRRNG